MKYIPRDNANICECCPCAFTDKSEQVQNLGCLPTVQDLIKMSHEGKNWGCHEDETKACVGFAIFCKEEEISYDPSLPLASYTKWYHTGEG